MHQTPAVSNTRPFCCCRWCNDALLELIDWKIRGIAFNWIEKLVDQIMMCLSATYRRLSAQRATRTPTGPVVRLEEGEVKRLVSPPKLDLQPTATSKIEGEKTPTTVLGKVDAVSTFETPRTGEQKIEGMQPATPARKLPAEAPLPLSSEPYETPDATTPWGAPTAVARNLSLDPEFKTNQFSTPVRTASASNCLEPSSSSRDRSVSCPPYRRAITPFRKGTLKRGQVPSAAVCLFPPSPRQSHLESLIARIQGQTTTAIEAGPAHRCTLQERLKGSLQGAILGATTTQSIQDNRPRTWGESGDMSLMLLDAYSKIQPSQPVLTIFAQSLVKWNSAGLSLESGKKVKPRIIDPTVVDVVKNNCFLANPVATAKSVWEESFDPEDSTCTDATYGSVIRAPIIGCIHYKDLLKVVTETRTLTEATHADPRAIAASVTVAVANAILLQGLQDIPLVLQHAVAIGEEVLREEISKKFNAGVNSEEHVADFRRFATQHVPMNEDAPLISTPERNLSASISQIRMALGEDCYECMKWAFHIFRGYDPQHPSGFADAIKPLTAHQNADIYGPLAGALLGSLIGYHRLPSYPLLDIDQQILDAAHEQLLKLTDAQPNRGNV